MKSVFAACCLSEIPAATQHHNRVFSASPVFVRKRHNFHQKIDSLFHRVVCNILTGDEQRLRASGFTKFSKKMGRFDIGYIQNTCQNAVLIIIIITTLILVTVKSDLVLVFTYRFHYRQCFTELHACFTKLSERVLKRPMETVSVYSCCWVE